MIFNSFDFLIFFCITFVLYYFSSQKIVQIGLLIISSFIFYAWQEPRLLILLTLVALINAFASYFAMYSIYRRLILWAGVIINLAVLAFFKYSKLFYETLGYFFTPTQIEPLSFLAEIPLPIGISFYIFQSISLLVDSYRDPSFTQITPSSQRSLMTFLAHFFKTIFFISFFPQLVAGPIIYSKAFWPQITSKKLRDIDGIFALKAILIGYFLKLFVADNLADFTKVINLHVIQFESSANLVVYLFSYSIQIFADFAGYSSIAIGLAALFGYKFPINFNYPFIARNMSEFWERWHISLSIWLRDYLFTPLAFWFARKGRSIAWAFGLTMFLGGLWHGASWNYVIWGLWHGLLLSLGALIAHFLPMKKPDWLTIPITFLCVTLSWTVFFISDYKQTIMFFKMLHQNIHAPASQAIIFYCLIYAMPVIILHVAAYIRENSKLKLSKIPTMAYSWGEAFLFAAMTYLMLTNYGVGQAFIYFQF